MFTLHLRLAIPLVLAKKNLEQKYLHQGIELFSSPRLTLG